MTLTIDAIKPHLLTGDRVVPFDSADGFTKQWWVRLDSSTHEWFTFTDSGEEVARAQIDPKAQIGSLYRDVPSPPRGFATIAFFEVRQDLHRQGIGRRAIALLQQKYPDTTMAAFSENADDFWTGLGWLRHEHRTKPRSQPLFLSPSVT